MTHHKWYTTVSVLYYVKHVFKTSSALETRYPTNCEMVLGPYGTGIARIPLNKTVEQFGNTIALRLINVLLLVADVGGVETVGAGIIEVV